jgi:hypothetical protein
MKKHIVFSGLLAASIFSLALIFSLAPTAHAQTATTCPAGYTCTPVAPQPVNCPVGFTCTSTVPTNPSPVGGGGGVGGSCIPGFVRDVSGNCIATSPALTLHVIVPNGGETLTIGQNYRIKWSGGKSNVDVWLLDNPTRLGKEIFSGIPNNGYIDWTVAPLNTSDLYNGKTGTYSSPSGQYVMFVSCSDNDCTVDDSDSSFSIASSSPSGGGGGGRNPCYYWSTNLGIGSSGPDVVALQTWLIANGYDIPAISSGRQIKGVYSVQTAAAVAKYQASVGLPTTGVLDTQTRVSLNLGSCATPTPPNPTSLNISLTSTPAPSTSGYAMAYRVTFDGTKYDPADVTIELSCSSQYVSWTSVGGGKTNACSNLSDYNTGIDMTRIADGDWRSTITFYNSSSQPQLVGATAKAWGGVNGKTLVSSDKDAFTLSAGTSTPVSSNGIVASLDPSSPVASTVQISTSAQTNNVPLAVFDIKSQGRISTLQSLQLNLNVNNSNGQNGPGALLNAVSIRVGGQTYFGTPSVSTCPMGYTCTSNSGISFSNMNVALPADVYVPVTVYANIAQDTNGSLDGSSASVSLPTGNIQAIDSNYNSVPVTTGTISGSTITFNGSGVQVSNTSATLGAQVCSVMMTACSQPATFTFSLTAGNQPIYVSNKETTALAGSLKTSLSTSLAVSPVSFFDNDTNGDSSTYFYIAPGQTKTFTAIYQITANGSTVAGVFSINPIFYSTSSSNLTLNSITSGLDNLQVPVTLNSGPTQQPSITSIYPTAGGLNTTVTINGSGFTSGNTVEFDQNSKAMGGISGPSLSSVTSNQIVFTLSSLTTANMQSGVYQVRVTNNYASNTGSNSVNFTLAGTCTYNCGTPTTTPSITVVSPNGGEVLVENSKAVDSLSSVDSAKQIFEIKWSGAPDSFTDVFGNGKNPARIAAYLDQNINGQWSTVGRIIPSAYGSIMWIVGEVSNTNCLMNNDNVALYPNHCENSIRLINPGNYYVRIVDTQTGAMDRSNNYFTITSAASTPPPSITLSDASGNQGITVNAGSTFTVQGTPQGLQELSYYTGMGNPPAGYYNRAWIFDPIFNNSCSNNNASTNGPWTFTCTAKTAGVGKISVQIYANGQTYTSNIVTVTVTPITSNQPPVISGGTFPTTLTVGQTGTWMVNASDPQNGSLSYSVNWGSTIQEMTASSQSVVQSSTFTHAYALAGNYTVTFTVTDSAGLSAKTTTTVRVTAPTPVCPAGYTCTAPGTTLACPAGYTCTPAAVTSCPSGYTCYTQTQNTSTNATATYSCPTGSTLDSSGNTCATTSSVPATAAYSCPPGLPPGSALTSANQCNIPATTTTIPATATYSCPTGSTLDSSGSNCTTASTAPAKVAYSCPSGYNINSNNTCSSVPSFTAPVVASPGGGAVRGVAVAPSPQVTTISATATYSCPSGSTLNSSNNTCSGTTNMAATATYSCPTGTLSGSICSKNLGHDTMIPATATYSCPTGSTLDSSSPNCITTSISPATATYSCPSGYTMNSNNTCTGTVSMGYNATNTASVWNSIVSWFQELFR